MTVSYLGQGQLIVTTKSFSERGKGIKSEITKLETAVQLGYLEGQRCLEWIPGSFSKLEKGKNSFP